MHWRDKAKCRGLDPNFFFPIGVTGRIPAGGERRNTDAAQRKVAEYCRDCPVKLDCLEWALANEEFGVAGGTTEEERKYILSSRARKKERAVV